MMARTSPFTMQVSAYGIIKNHGGIISVNSEIGYGTTFNIYLPISDREAQPKIYIDEKMVKGSITILLIDDEQMIIEVGKAMLEKLGYRVIAARGGEAAIKMISEIGSDIDLAILDMVMPGADGGWTFERLREIQPDLPVILSSGYAINGEANEIIRKGCKGFIQKPFTISELSRIVRHSLEGIA